MKSVASRALGALLLSFVGWVAVSQPTHSQATDVFFVSAPATTPGASDDHSCDAARRVETPRRTIARAMECLTPGAVLYVRGGTYMESLGDGASDYSGTSWERATRIVPYNGEPVLIKAPAGANFTIQIGRRHHVVFERLTIDGSGVIYDAVKLNGASHHIRFQDGSITGSTHQGVNIQDAATGHEIVRMEIHGNGQTQFDHGVYIASSGNLVEHSRIHDNSGYGVHVYNGACNCAGGNVVRANRVYRNGVRSEGFGVLLGSGGGNAAFNNLIYGNRGGIQVAHGAPRDTLVFNNTVVGNGSWGGIVVQAETAATQIKNNIVYGSGGDDLSNAAPTTVFDRNLVGVDPRFIDATSGNFGLQATSPAINQGVALPQVPTDFDGASRPVGGAYDIGAHEHGGAGRPPAPTNLRIRG
jgi:serralysin